MMMDNNAQTHKRWKHVKANNKVLPQKLAVAVEVCGETNSKRLYKDRKTVTDVKM